MKQLWAVVFPLVRSSVLNLAKVVLAFLVLSAALFGVRYFLLPNWQEAEAALQSAQAQLDEAQAEQADVQAHLDGYRRLVDAGLVGTEPRATWVEDVLRSAKDLGLQDRVGFNLAPPESVAMAEAEVAQASVGRHALEVQVGPVHELEALRLFEQLRARHAEITQIASCQFSQPNPDGLTARCRINFLHIDLTPLPPETVPE